MSLPVREVLLEILRHGQAHNQFISPLTQYLALCGSHPATTLSVPLEHRRLEYLLSRMSYPDNLDPESDVVLDRAHAREELASAVTALFENIPALPHEGRVNPGEMLHIRLMTTPQELAMLPFELAAPPSGFDDGGQPLLLGPTPDAVLTREVRRNSNVDIRIPTRPRVLLVIADPTGSGVPAHETEAAIASALSPWIRPEFDNGEYVPDIQSHLVVLQHASLEEIRYQCETGNFTHVHILAHGAENETEHQGGFGLALCNNNDKESVDVVDGPTLARALRPPQDNGTWASPWCVVLCTCDSGNIGSVVHPNASLAHSLHVARIPFVLASQYPLTFGAAVTLANRLYPLELRGEDPRRTLRDVRHAIASEMRHTHDWASLVAYAGWPEDLPEQLEQIRLARLLDQLEVAQAWADVVLANTKEFAIGGNK